MIKDMNPDQFGILIDMGVCMAAASMACSMSVEEIEVFFELNKDRLRMQGLNENDIIIMTETVKEAVLKIKMGFGKENI